MVGETARKVETDTSDSGYVSVLVTIFVLGTKHGASKFSTIIKVVGMQKTLPSLT